MIEATTAPTKAEAHAARNAQLKAEAAQRKADRQAEHEKRNARAAEKAGWRRDERREAHEGMVQRGTVKKMRLDCDAPISVMLDPFSPLAYRPELVIADDGTAILKGVVIVGGDDDAVLSIEPIYVPEALAGMVDDMLAEGADFQVELVRTARDDVALHTLSADGGNYDADGVHHEFS